MHSPGLRCLASLAVVAALVLAWTLPCLATTVVPMSDADLASQAAAVVLGRVTALQSHLDATGQILTDVTLAVDEVVAGHPLPATVTLRQPGGQVGHVRSWIDGSPEFLIGERVLVYLRVARDGTLRVLQLYQGKLSVMTDPLTGDEVAIRITGGGVRVLAPLRRGPTSPPQDTHRLEDLRRTIRAARLRALPTPSSAPMQTAPAVAADVVQQQDAFVFLGTPSRWFEPDTGAAITMAINSAGQPQAPTLGFDQVRQGLAAWSNDPQANFRYADGGVTAAAGLRLDGVNAVSFNDPDGIMDPPVNCSGILALGGFSRSTTESRVVNGTTFMRILDGDVVFNDGWQGCGFYETFSYFAEVATHELGHVLGLGHSTDPTATMYATAHFDGRGASLRADDLAGLRFIYPASGPTLAFSAPANGATVSGTTIVSLAVSGGAAPYTYRVSLDGTLISTSASFSWNTPAVSDGAHTLSATVTDAGGSTASAAVTVTVANGGGGAGTLRVAITQPTSGATVSGVPWAVIWVEGTSGASNTFTLSLAGQPMGTTTTASRGPISMPYDTRGVANGAQPLTATVRDAAGNTGATTLSVIVSNASAPLSAAFTSPAAGATVSGQVTVGMAASGGTAPYTYTLALDGTQLASGSSTTYTWNSAAASNGSHTLGLTVRDAAGATATATRGVTVQNGAALSATITAPANGATVSGTVTLTASASGGAPPYAYAFSVDGGQVSAGTAASYAWNSASVGNGAHTLGVTVSDAAGGSVSRSVAVTVSNGAPAPPPSAGTLQVFITSPASGTTVSGTAWVTLWLDGASGASNTYTLTVASQTVATTTTSSTGPVSIPWSTFAVADGAQTLTASARDATGNTGAASIAITVANGATPPPLSASFTSPAAGATLSGTVTVAMAASGGTTPYTYTLAIDGAVVSSGAGSSYAWSTTAVADGTHTLALTVTDAGGRTATASRTVSVSNAAAPAPGGTLRVFITSPASGASASGTVWVNIWVEGAAAGAKVFTLRAGAATVGTATDSGVHVTLPWNTPATPNGATTLSATVQDASGASGTTSIPVTVAN